ncbi:MAG: hypothetical protein H0V17_32525 [Deltaproteobacteria bacterium]|nr:hypothetical protein [Deltaproteobacteria bacterium]
MTGKKIVGMLGLVASIGGVGTIAVIMATGACGRKEPEFAGIGKYRFGHTTRGDVKDGVCQPTSIDDGKRQATWCFALPAYKIANRTAEIELYFDGTEATSPLIEIQLKVRGCLEQDLESWMRTAFGPPIENTPKRLYYKNSFLWAAALIPSEPGRCRVHLLPNSELAQIAKVKAL